MNKNIIQKAILDLQYNGTVDGIALQRSIGDWANEELLSILDTQLQKADKNDRLIKIDRLDIDIDLSGKEGMTEQLSKKLNEQLIYALNKVIEGKALSEPVEAMSLSGSFAEEVLFFIEHGDLPWWSRVNKQQDFFKELQIFTETKPGSKFLNSLISLIANENVQRRLAWQMHDIIFYRIIYWLAPSLRSSLPALIKEMDQVKTFVAQQEMRSIETIFKNSLLSNISSNAEDITVGSILRSFIEGLENAGFGSVIKVGIDKAVTPLLKKYTTKAKPGPPTKGSLKKKQMPGTSDPSKQTEGGKGEIIPVAASGGIYINNAGLVIIAGFLPHFFKRLGIMSDNVITDKNKAAFLVQFLASGNEAIAEFELGLSKILCDIGMEEAVDTSIVLSGKEKNEANDLLLSAIEYWNILRDTSVEGLRGSFLMRSGKIWFENEEWHLLVEQKPYDMLLQHLPWSINIIRLPWMRYPLRTEWAY